MKKNYLISVILVTGILAGCEEVVDPATNRIFLLTENSSKTWTTLSIESTEEKEGINCEEDDQITFSLFDDLEKEPRFVTNDGFIRCDYDDSYLLKAGSWRLNNSKTRIILTYGVDQFRTNDLYDILELTNDKLVLRKRIESFNTLLVKTQIITYESR